MTWMLAFRSLLEDLTVGKTRILVQHCSLVLPGSRRDVRRDVWRGSGSWIMMDRCLGDHGWQEKCLKLFGRSSWSQIKNPPVTCRHICRPTCHKSDLETFLCMAMAAAYHSCRVGLPLGVVGALEGVALLDLGGTTKKPEISRHSQATYGRTVVGLEKSLPPDPHRNHGLSSLNDICSLPLQTWFSCYNKVNVAQDPKNIHTMVSTNKTLDMFGTFPLLEKYWNRLKLRISEKDLKKKPLLSLASESYLCKLTFQNPAINLPYL